MKTIETDVLCLKVGDKVLSHYNNNQINIIISKSSYIPPLKSPMAPEGGFITGGTQKHAFTLILENDKGKYAVNYTYDVVFKKVLPVPERIMRKAQKQHTTRAIRH